MPARLRLADHLDPEDLFARSRAAEHPTARAHWQVLWMIRQGVRTQDVSEAIGSSPTWIRKLVGRSNEGGADALGDRRRPRN